ncbi:MAG TPA: hypothetical protein VJU61_11100 [Polyangiaceae bacterium]|nr:hypothetical protein [Polyangiaceae bacterium]
MSQMRQTVSSTGEALEFGEGPLGFTCQDVSIGNGSAGTGSVADDFWMQETAMDDGLLSVAGSLDVELHRKFYGRDFIMAAGFDQVTLTTASGAQYELTYWGARSCESTPP